jgi:drug/metabolite transporter (DMT)-like permease
MSVGTRRLERGAVSSAAIATAGLVAVTAIWGLSFVLIRDALHGTSAIAFIVARFGVAAAVLALPLLRGGRSRGLRQALRAGALPGLALLAGYLLQTFGLERTTAARAGFITGLSVVLVPPLARSLREQPLRPRAVLALLPATLGLALLTLHGGGSSSFNLGDLLVLGCAVAFALQIVLLSPRQGAGQESLDATALTFWQTAIVCAGALLLLPADGLRIDGSGAVAAAFLGLAGTALALWVQTAAQRHVSAARVAFVYTGEPLFAALFAALLGGESLGWATLAGGALIVGAMLFGG